MRYLSWLLLLVAGSTLGGCASKQAEFSDPDSAVQALVDSLRPYSEARLTEVLGPDSANLVSSGDSVADQNRRDRFLDLYNQKHVIDVDSNDDRVLVIGNNAWPFPIPIVRQNGKWVFDTVAGKDEIINRRIGENELSTIQTCLAIVDAQREYTMTDPDGDGLHDYAAKFFSDPGKKDGLYWNTADNEPASPLGSLVADAAEEGYAPGGASRDRPSSYHGYYFRILTSQGPYAPGGAEDYIVKGHMIGGFGLVAWPASYGSSGIMTFITNQDGVVYQQDLGDSTATAAKKITSFDPGDGWMKVEPGR